MWIRSCTESARTNSGSPWTLTETLLGTEKGREAAMRRGKATTTGSR